MAIIYSYPHAVPTINDMVLGAKFRENEGISTNSFYISDIVTLVQEQVGTIPTLQEVTEQGANTIDQIQINGIDVATINDIPGTPTLQEVTDIGNTTTNPIIISNTSGYSYFQAESGNNILTLQIQDDFGTTIEMNDAALNRYGSISSGGIFFEETSSFQVTLAGEYLQVTNAVMKPYLYLGGSDGVLTGYAFIKTDLLDNTYNQQLPPKDGTFAMLSDIPTSAYRVYTAIINQSGTAAPFVVNVLENTLGGTVTFEYVSPGIYNAVLVGEFTVNKTTALLWGGTSSQLFKAFAFSADRVGLVTYNTSGSVANDQMGITTLEIRVYN